MKAICALALVVGLAGCGGGEEVPPPVTPQKEVAKENTPIETAKVVIAPAAKDDAIIPATTSNAEALKAYRAALDLFDNGHGSEARLGFQQARKLDPKFASAMAGEGSSTPGPDGEKLLADAAAQSTSLPESEQTLIKLTQALHADDSAKTLELATKLTTLAPKAWRAYLVLGSALQTAGKYDDAVAAFKKGIAVDPTAGPVYNWLAYVEVQQGKIDDATTHLKKYVELQPSESNAYDSLGEILLLSNKLDDAAAAFEKATTLSPKLSMAWGGLGLVRLYKGDYAKAYEAFGKERDAAANIQEKSLAAHNVAVAQFAQNKVPEALKTLDAFDAEATKDKNEEPTVWSAFDRAGILLESGKGADALKVLALVSAKIDKLEIEPNRKQRLHGYDFQFQTMTYARLGKAAEADKARASTEEALSKLTDAEARDVVATARGEALMTKGDAKGAVEAYKGCLPTDDWCSMLRMKAEEKAGDKAAAKATKEILTKVHRRDAWSFFAYTRVK